MAQTQRRPLFSSFSTWNYVWVGKCFCVQTKRKGMIVLVVLRWRGNISLVCEHCSNIQLRFIKRFVSSKRWRSKLSWNRSGKVNKQTNKIWMARDEAKPSEWLWDFLYVLSLLFLHVPPRLSCSFLFLLNNYQLAYHHKEPLGRRYFFWFPVPISTWCTPPLSTWC